MNNTKYRIRRHTPAFVDRDLDPIIPFDTLEELLQIDFVKSSVSLPGHYKLSVALVPGECHHLISEFKEGYEWWVLGYIYEDAGVFDLDLPKWKPKYKKETT